MTQTLTIFVNDDAVHDYDCETVLSDEQLGFLDRMDKDMGRGIKIRGELIAEPDPRQRAEFVALNLIRALQQENEPGIAVSCAYLCNRIDGLQAVHVRDSENGLSVELLTEDQAPANT